MALRRILGAAAAAVTLSACSAGGRPPELAGLWSAGPAACAAGVGVRFGNDAISAYYDDRRETLFPHPEYVRIGQGAHMRIRIRYELPHLPGGARSVGAYGILVLERDENGGIHPVAHNMIDRRTGSARLTIANDPAMRSLALSPCGPRPWGVGGLRGRDEA